MLYVSHHYGVMLINATEKQIEESISLFTKSQSQSDLKEKLNLAPSNRNFVPETSVLSMSQLTQQNQTEHEYETLLFLLEKFGDMLLEVLALLKTFVCSYWCFCIVVSMSRRHN